MDIETLFSDIEKSLEKLKDLHSKAMTAVVTQTRKGIFIFMCTNILDIKMQLGQLIKETSSQSKEAKQKLEKLQEANQARKKEVGGKNTAEIRIRELQTSQLIQRFQKMIQQFQQMQSEYKQRYKERVKRSYKITNPDATDEEIEQMVKEGDVEVYQKKAISNAQKHTLNAIYEEVKETHQDIVMLEQSLMELHEMFVQFAALVEYQDDLIDNIENNVFKAEAFVEESIKKIKESQKLETKNRWTGCCIIVSVIVLFIVVLVLLGGGGIGKLLF